MNKNRNYHKKAAVAKDRFVGIRLDRESFSKVEEAAMAAGLSISEYIRRVLAHRRITIKEEIVVEVPVIKELLAALGKIGANLNQIAHHFNAGGVLSQQMYRETMKAYADLYAMKFEIEKLGGELRSHPEAYAVKNSNYRQMQQYLLFQHERNAGKPILDDEGRLVPRDGILIDGINCDSFSFPTECVELNRQWGKNSGFGEIKAHHYIISFDPRDGPDHGLTPEKAQAIGMEFANRFFAGHQALVVTHTDGHNHTGNLHFHIVLNNLRKFAVPWDDFMERPIDAQAGYKHNPTMKLIRFMLHALNAICEREHLYTLDLSLPANTRITDREYHQQAREQEKLYMKNADMLADGLSPRNLRYANAKEKIRSAIDSAVSRAKTEEEFLSIIKEESGVSVRSRRGVCTFEIPDYKRGIRGRSLGYAYEREAILERTAGRFVNRETVPPEYAALPRIFLVHSELRLVVDLQNCVKARQSRAYARKVQISNLQEMARTVAFIQEQGIATLDALNANYEATQERYRAASSALRETGAQLAEVNEQIHYMGAYLSGKNVYQEFLHAKDKAAFRAAHRGEIANYEKAVRFLKEKFAGAAFPSVKALKAQKAALTRQRSRQKEVLRQSGAERRQMEIIRTNVSEILGREQPYINRETWTL